MLRAIDRYVLREFIPPFGLSLLVLTFLLMLPPIMEIAEELIARGVDPYIVLQMMATLLPQGLGITIPMALLVGVLMGLGRLSGDRETVAMQACGISLTRILSPLLFLATIAGIATCYILIVALPDANQAFRELSYQTVANRAEGEVQPRVFNDDFPNVTLYVQEVSTTGQGWSNVFLADTTNAEEPRIYTARSGRVVLDRENRTVDVVLQNGTGHTSNHASPSDYESHTFDELVISLDAEAAFPRNGPQRGLAELTVRELDNERANMTEMGLSAHAPIMHIHRKFSIPFACLVFALLGVAFGVTSRKDGRLASFALGIGVIFAYYVVMYMSEALAKGQLLSPHWAMWVPNIFFGLIGLALLVWRSKSVERRFTLFSQTHATDDHDEDTPEQIGPTDTAVKINPKSISGFNLLDWYVTKLYLHWVLLAFIGLVGIFYISTFIDLSDKLFKGQTSGYMLLEYFWYATPQFVYYVLPIAGLVSALITVGVLTKTSELTIMKACGISLYRVALPIFGLSLVWSACLFFMGETILARSNQRAEHLNQLIRTGSSQTVDVLNRRWLATDNGEIYHYNFYDPNTKELVNLSVYEFDQPPWTLQRQIHASHAKFDAKWNADNVWVRTLGTSDESSHYEALETTELPFLEHPDRFEAESPDAELLNFRELELYIDDLGDRGFEVLNLVVALHRKASFPFVSFILTLIAVPFAVTTGPRGALFGVGVGIALAFSYWIILSIFGAIGTAGIIAPALAAWAPNVIFGASAGYFLLTVKT